MRTCLTGTPGTGKTVLGKRLAGFLGAEYVDVNRLIKQHGLADRKKEVNLKRLQGVLKRILSKHENVVVESHLLCEFQLPCDAVVVLRCNPLVLRERLRRRGYGKKKTRDNALCEALDYCLVNAELHYGKNRKKKAKIVQVDCTRLPSVRELARRIRSGKSGRVDWSQSLREGRLLKEGKL